MGNRSDTVSRLVLRVACCGALLFAAPALHDVLTAAQSCETLASLALPGTTVTLAQVVPTGTFVMPGAGARNPEQTEAQKNLPTFCRVSATLKPTGDSDIKIEVWMPASGWNGKFQAVGNGGWAGSIGYAAMVEALSRGYATAGTDTGHTGGSASVLLGHPEKLIDYAYRSEHEMTASAKTITAAFYGRRPTYSYWNGCSAGGKQGLKEAQRFPEDYDGIVAGAPAADWTGRASASLRIAQAMHEDAAAYIPPAKYPMIHEAVLAACDALDGVKDGVLENPAQCRFDPEVLACKNADTASCLTANQVQVARKIYAPAVNRQTGREIPSLSPGSELGWATWGGPQPLGIAFDHFKYVVFKDPAWDFRKFSFDTDAVLAEKMDDNTINAIDPNLKPFFDRGGKLLQYHGWSDPQISPSASVQYYQRVAAALGGAARIQGAYRLFMVPGMAHCGGGEGPNRFDAMTALEQWVEHKKAPERLIASRLRNGKVDRERPLCPYPQVASYNGKGSTDEAANFTCRLAPAGTRR